jgi:RHS repeat-associated protein
MDGDGLADFAVTALDGSVSYCANRGRLAWGPRQVMSIQDSPPPSPFGNPNVKTADIDFDKNIDIIQSVSTGIGADYRIWFNLGNQNYSHSITVPQAAGLMFSSPGVQIADLNGDRVPDVALITPQSVIITAGLGYGHFADPIAVTIPDVVLDDTQIAKAKLIDINGDGLADLVIERAAPGQLWYWLNLGNYTFSRRKIISGLPTAIGADAVVRWADLNGNGTTDLIYADSSAVPRLQTIDVGELIDGATTLNTLVAISNGIGRVTLIGYASSTQFRLEDSAAGQPWPDLMPMPVSVVASVTNLDSLGHQYVTRFRYHNGYYDPSEKQFRGFARAEQVDVGDASAPTLVTRSFFDTGRINEAMKGKLLALSTEQGDGNVFWTQTNSWMPVTLYTGTNGTNVVYAHPTGTMKLISELGRGTPHLLETEVAYDNYGNETTNADYGIVENGDRRAGNDERIITTEYALNTNTWILRHPSRQEIKDLNGVVLSRVESYYDDETFSGNNLGAVDVGNLTLRREWIDASIPNAHIKAARTKYDPYGNPVMLADPLAVSTNGQIDFTKGHVREIGYDSDFHTYPTSETIHVGNGSQDLVFQAAYDHGFGRLISSLDFNTNQTTYGYDTFARLINIVRPYDSANYPTVEYDYALAVPTDSNSVVNYIETRQLDKTPGTLGTNKRDYYFISRQFVDGLGRDLMTKTEAEPSPDGSATRVIIRGATLFNARKKPSVMLNPCFSQISSSNLDDLLAFENIEDPNWHGLFQLYSNLVSLTLSNAHKTVTAYDATLREVAATNQDGTFRQTVYEPLLTRSSDENQTDPTSTFYGNSMIYYYDGLGRLARVDEVTHLNDDGTEFTNVNHWTTTYQYDLNDQLKCVTDSQNNVKLMTYDGLKRKTFMDDPDRGHVTYVYDDASNLAKTTDAKSQIITYTYDGVNRILSEDYHDEGLPFSANKVFDSSRPITQTNRPDVAYFYDVAIANLPQGNNTNATANHSRGMLSYVWDLSGEEHNSYDARGRIEYIVKRIPDPAFWTNIAMPISPGWFVSYRTSFQYDSIDRMVSLTYPNNDGVTYQYNSRNLLQTISGGPNTNVISSIAYCPSGQQLQIDYGNGVRTTYEYDNRLRLKNLRTISQPLTLNQQLINFAYDFDGVSNIRQITDNRPGSAVPAGDPRRNTQVFQYDDLYRLTRAEFCFNLPDQPVQNNGVINYGYDRIGNMLSQTSTISDTDPSSGLPIANLGTMASGGTAGRFNRNGRAATDPPGPHALSQISNLQSPIPNRTYSYDENGNMLNIDGLACTWDFKGRLVAVENDQMRAQYTYDFTDRRISKNVSYKSGSSNFTNHDSHTTILYINKQFEVREHETPTEFVFNGDTRVAQMTDPLLRTQSIQYYCEDHLKSASCITDAKGSVITEHSYFPFGADRIHTSSEATAARYGFTQKERDAESEMHYFEARFLESSLARFILADPAASDLNHESLMIPQKLNGYAYARNNPVVYVDPLGTAEESSGTPQDMAVPWTPATPEQMCEARPFEATSAITETDKNGIVGPKGDIVEPPNAFDAIAESKHGNAVKSKQELADKIKNAPGCFTEVTIYGHAHGGTMSIGGGRFFRRDASEKEADRAAKYRFDARPDWPSDAAVMKAIRDKACATTQITVYLMGCNVANGFGGNADAGHAMLQRMADATGAKVCAPTTFITSDDTVSGLGYSGSLECTVPLVP